MDDEERLDWNTVMQSRIRSLTAKSVNGYTHWIQGALHEFNYVKTSYYLEHKEITVECGFCDN